MAARKRLGGQMLDAATTTGWIPFLGAATTQMAPNPLRPKDCRGAAASAVLALLDDVQRHRRRRAVLHTRPWRRQRGSREFFSRLLPLGPLRDPRCTPCWLLACARAKPVARPLRISLQNFEGSSAGLEGRDTPWLCRENATGEGAFAAFKARRGTRPGNARAPMERSVRKSGQRSVGRAASEVL